MKEKVLDTIRDYKLISENDNIVIGVSGGPDSMALLYVLLEIKAHINFNIHIAHVNHGVRGEEARSDQLFVERIARELNLPYHTINVDMVEYGKEKGISAEEAGRELRYGFFREILRNTGGGKIAVAHNKNDQGETLLMRIMRGTGIDGLKGMDFIIGDIIRPILGIDRKEIEEYIEMKGIETVLDKTNLESIYTRNKIRLELIPYIEENFNPNIINTLWRMSRISTLDSEFLENYSQRKLNDMIKKQTKDRIVLNGNKFFQEERSIQQRIIRVAIMKILPSLQGISEAQITSVLNLFLSFETGKEAHLSNSLIARVNYDDLIIERKKEDLAEDFIFPIDITSTNILGEIGYSMEFKIHEKDIDFSMEKANNIRYFDLDKIKGNLMIRNRRDGDRFFPFGMKGSKKLKDYFIDEKIPRSLRRQIPLLIDDENIIWVIGFRTSQLYRIDDTTKRVLEVRYKRKNNTY